MRPVFIISTGASATKYIARVLVSLGVAFGHERMRRDGMVSWEFVLPGVLGFWKADKSQEPIILHQVRDPLKTINSLRVTHAQYSWKKISASFQNIHIDMPIIQRCMRYWYEANIAAERLAQWTYRIEDLFYKWDTFCRCIKRPDLIEKRFNITDISHQTNSKLIKIQKKALEPGNLTWAHLCTQDRQLTRMIRGLAVSYGYEWKSI